MPPQPSSQQVDADLSYLVLAGQGAAPGSGRVLDALARGAQHLDRRGRPGWRRGSASATPFADLVLGVAVVVVGDQGAGVSLEQAEGVQGAVPWVCPGPSHTRSSERRVNTCGLNARADPACPSEPGTVLDRVDRRLIGEGHRLGQQRGLQVVFEPVKAPGQPAGGP